jgi:hypothetical protein
MEVTDLDVKIKEGTFRDRPSGNILLVYTISSKALEEIDKQSVHLGALERHRIKETILSLRALEDVSTEVPVLVKYINKKWVITLKEDYTEGVCINPYAIDTNKPILVLGGKIPDKELRPLPTNKSKKHLGLTLLNSKVLSFI